MRKPHPGLMPNCALFPLNSCTVLPFTPRANGGSAMLDIGAVIVFAWCVVIYLIVQVVAYVLIF